MLILASLVMMLLFGDGQTFSLALDGVPSARYCRVLGKSVERSDIRWSCPRKADRRIPRVL